LNGNQMRNALHALFRILTVQDRGSLVDVLETYIALARHPTKEIRSEAVQLAIGLVRYINSTTVRYTNITIPVPITFSDKEEKALRDAMALGLTPKVADLAAKFFGHEV
jgi:hypothetical protein